MNKLEVGMYVRYKTLSNQIKIAKIIEIDDREILDLDNKDCTNEKYIIGQPSFNIIDLVQVGDYVNGCYVTNKQASHNEGITIIPKRIGIIKCNAYFNQGNYNDCDFKWIEEEYIKSIVTKEQFEAMKYEIGDNNE